MLGATWYSTEQASRVCRAWVRDGRLAGLPAKRSRGQKRESMVLGRSLQSKPVRTMLVVMLVLVVVVTALPIFVGSTMTSCPDCGPSQLGCAVGCALLLPPVAALPLLAPVGLVVARSGRRYRIDYSWLLDPPPRLA